MDTVTFLEALKEFSLAQTENMIFPTQPQKGETEPQYRAANVYRQSLPNGHTATKYAPYILHKIVTGDDTIGSGKRNKSIITVRSIFCVYNEDAEEGSLMLLNLMETMRIAFLKYPLLDNRYRLYTGDEDGHVQRVVYQEDIQPYYAGELVTVWEIPSVQEEPPEMNWQRDYTNG